MNKVVKDLTSAKITPKSQNVKSPKHTSSIQELRRSHHFVEGDFKDQNVNKDYYEKLGSPD